MGCDVQKTKDQDEVDIIKYNESTHKLTLDLQDIQENKSINEMT